MLTERQIELLKAIINEYLNSSEPVGSEIIVQKYKIKCSAATVRNEMARLIDEGFLQMLHTSSGRVPTATAYRYFLSDLMEEEELPVLQEVAMKQRLWPNRFEFEKLLRNAAVSLADVTKEAAVITVQDGYVINSGGVNLLENPEFWDINTAKAALYLMDSYELLMQLFDKSLYGGDLRVLIGDEIGNDNLRSAGILFSPYSTRNKQGFVAVLGPARMRYSNVVPAVRYTKRLLEELGDSW
ncbi:hypothetical protein A3F07_00185 [candidate division WWE3 bacterium RIFCSPHIGHO2_12_FULL_38_15]|uniref:Heat-inducible transcription repressor HrcA n=1 Tax=candidate division WWE3 bacterium RIFCSPHIGHO2_02_FULL_38_14 TaxID=1802620 RepID=A0A1F4VBG3_UNCKA|nr:MAG: hypothetical protein A2793_04610 [candidate division WWE3 bacterium RIFCSPHIGHO2_01_FULL_38_45]OGC49257.1 MAG: hypothetical protein A3F07_00185 [candidate division WWE3 bacterium RIFCSPHIGHO2_12_FULL_38_15]OGC54001.1 MAG: hypothetical protein A3B64_02725 [candidate division WWE3 bacterium RIFCSPLOWO2_01_FULL_37_24]OGC54546.1 MAG: hypothetical protein A3D91_03085 [candidate division WWE3 bacterium RIFCSPHIGHO2_02_FULL_38_14]HLB51290.1 hypothetical protein [Patescibacteria group bacterium